MILVLDNANVIGGAAPGVAPGVAVTIDGDRIVDMGPAGRNTPAGARVIDLAGAYLYDAQFLNCAQLVVTRNWHSAFRDEALGCGAAIPPREPSR